MKKKRHYNNELNEIFHWKLSKKENEHQINSVPNIENRPQNKKKYFYKRK